MELKNTAADTPGPGGENRLLAAFGHRNFRLYYGGQTVSLIGTWMQMTALGWFVYDLTGKNSKLGEVWFAAQIPNLFLAPIAGVLLDRYSRHRFVLMTQALAMLQATVLAYLVLWDHINFHGLMVMALLLGLVNAFDMPGRQAFVVELVDRTDLQNAIALNSFSFNMARVVGPPIAGFLIHVLSEGGIFLINAFSFVAILCGLLAMRIPPVERPPREGSMARSLARSLAEGAGFILSHAALRDVLLLIGLTSLMGMPFQILMPSIVRDTLGHGAREYGIVLAAVGLGSIVGAVFLAKGFMADRTERLISLASIAFGGGLVAFSLSRHYVPSALILIPTGWAMMVQTLASNTLLQRLVPDRLRGRVMSLYTMMLLGIYPLGSVMMGHIADQIGPLAAIRIGGVACGLGGLALLSRSAKLRASVCDLGG